VNLGIPSNLYYKIAIKGKNKHKSIHDTKNTITQKKKEKEGQETQLAAMSKENKSAHDMRLLVLKEACSDVLKIQVTKDTLPCTAVTSLIQA
jgi:hypothetical protein